MSPEDPAPPEPDEQAPQRSSRWTLAGLFLLGALSVTLLVLPKRYPVRTYATWCKLRYGAAPSARGLVMTLGPCPADLRGRGPGPWVLLEFRDISAQPNLLVLPELAGEELVFEVQADGEVLASKLDPARETVAQALRAHHLGPLNRVAIPVDVSRYVELPASWERLELAVLRVQLGGDGHTLRAEGAISR